jgi:hypothetical protein
MAPLMQLSFSEKIRSWETSWRTTMWLPALPSGEKAMLIAPRSTTWLLERMILAMRTPSGSSSLGSGVRSSIGWSGMSSGAAGMTWK